MNGEKESIIIKLKENGCRITKQRKMILDIILEDRCSSCKEIYARVVKLDQSIGMATVYRLVKELENIGVLSREIVYKEPANDKIYHYGLLELTILNESCYYEKINRVL